jgi:amino acid adenylation domain-containing protein
MDMGGIVSKAAELYPNKVALHDGQQSYTFGEVERRSRDFAGTLVSRGVSTGDRIAYCVPKSASLIIAILGCLKAGAVYVPVDHKLPKSRLLFILNDIHPRIIVSSRAQYDSLAAELAAAPDWIDGDQLLEYAEDSVSSRPLPQPRPEDVAYCIYTSGSTGQPKGVLIKHSSVDVFYRAFADVMTIDAQSICMNTSALYFDVHIMDLFYPLYCGATVHLSCGPLVANSLLRTIERERITHFTAVGSLMTMMSEGSLFDSCDLSSVRRIMTGAEVINVGTMQKWLRKIPGLSIVNGYGPTEATVICTYFLIDRLETDRSAFYPIGKALKGTKLLLLDGDRTVAEPNSKGELLIGGPQVMKGYWQNEGQNRDKIVRVGGERYYRSGDICQWLSDGNLDFVGRVDEEIKLLGFRISLSEIKRVMDATVSVREGHPVVAEHPALGKVIAACFTATGDRSVDETAGDDRVFGKLQAVFKRELPYYMVPSLYFLFDEFPKLPSGKTDKKQILQQVNRRIHGAAQGLTRFFCYEEMSAE